MASQQALTLSRNRHLADVPLLGSLPREWGPHAPVIFADAQSVVIRRWHDHRSPDFATRHRNLLIATVPGREPAEILQVVAVHGDLYSAGTRLANATTLRRFADPAVPCLIAARDGLRAVTSRADRPARGNAAGCSSVQTWPRTSSRFGPWASTAASCSAACAASVAISAWPGSIRSISPLTSNARASPVVSRPTVTQYTCQRLCGGIRFVHQPAAVAVQRLCVLVVHIRQPVHSITVTGLAAR